MTLNTISIALPKKHKNRKNFVSAMIDAGLCSEERATHILTKIARLIKTPNRTLKIAMGDLLTIIEIRKTYPNHFYISIDCKNHKQPDKCFRRFLLAMKRNEIPYYIGKPIEK